MSLQLDPYTLEDICWGQVSDALLEHLSSGLLSTEWHQRPSSEEDPEEEHPSLIEIWTGENRLRLFITETPHTVFLGDILVEEPGTGLGTEAMSQLFSYCDRQQKPLVVVHVYNHRYFSNFGCLERIGPTEPQEDGATGDSYLYRPA